MNSEEHKARRKRKFQLQDGLCYWCKRPMTLQLLPSGKPPHNYASFEHLVRRREGGYGMPHNTVLACRSCNEEREHGIQTHLLEAGRAE